MYVNNKSSELGFQDGFLKDKTMNPLHFSIYAVLSCFTGLLAVALTGIFDGVELDLGFETYAEETWAGVDLMPLNTVINLCYIGLGLYWIRYINTLFDQQLLNKKDAQLFYCFNIMASLYGCVQLLRIIKQSILWSILDQWCTLPFFAFLLEWGTSLKNGSSPDRCIIIFMMSILSYSLTLLSTIGFELSLGFHIVAAVVGAMRAYRKYPSPQSWHYFAMALVSCSGFVMLKVLDLHLPKISICFKYISGHFLSKICDVLQIYYVNLFFLDITFENKLSTEKQFIQPVIQLASGRKVL